MTPTISIPEILNFVGENFAKIIFSLIAVSLFYSLYFLSASSLKKLRIEVFRSYPFDEFIPSSGSWSVGYFLIIVLALGLLIFFLFRGRFYYGPA